jgi:hypothetical protein
MNQVKVTPAHQLSNLSLKGLGFFIASNLGYASLIASQLLEALSQAKKPTAHTRVKFICERL